MTAPSATRATTPVRCPDLFEELLANLCSGEELGRRHLVTVVLRLVLDWRGQLVHGEIINTGSRLVGRFSDWDHLGPALRAWLEREPVDGERTPSTDPGASERKDRPCP